MKKIKSSSILCTPVRPRRPKRNTKIDGSKTSGNEPIFKRFPLSPRVLLLFPDGNAAGEYTRRNVDIAITFAATTLLGRIRTIVPFGRGRFRRTRGRQQIHAFTYLSLRFIYRRCGRLKFNTDSGPPNTACTPYRE